MCFCRFLHTTAECKAFSSPSSGQCKLFSSVDLELCDPSSPLPQTLAIAYRGNRLDDFHSAPSSSSFAVAGTVDSRGNGSIRSCLNACLSSSLCEAAAIDFAVAGECTLYTSAKYEAADGIVNASRMVFVSFSKVRRYAQIWFRFCLSSPSHAPPILCSICLKRWSTAARTMAV